MNNFYIWFFKLLDTATFDILIPAVILATIGLLLLYVLWQAQRRPDFDIALFLKDENGTYSAAKTWGFVCLGIHSWCIATLVFQKTLTENHLLFYSLVWAGTPVALEIARKWTGNLPFAQAGTGPTQQVNLTPAASSATVTQQNDPPQPP